MFSDTLYKELERMQNTDRESRALVAVLIKKLGGKVTITNDELENAYNGVWRIHTYIDEVNGGKILEVK